LQPDLGKFTDGVQLFVLRVDQFLYEYLPRFQNLVAVALALDERLVQYRNVPGDPQAVLRGSLQYRL
jgi:hypothetical protein